MDPVAQFEAEFNWALLVVSDADSDLQVQRTDPPRPLSSSKDAAVIDVQHGQTGETLVRVWNARDTAMEKVLLGKCRLSIPTGRFVLGDVTRDITSVVDVGPGAYELEVYGDNAAEAAIVDILMTGPA